MSFEHVPTEVGALMADPPGGESSHCQPALPGGGGGARRVAFVSLTTTRPRALTRPWPQTSRYAASHAGGLL